MTDVVDNVSDIILENERQKGYDVMNNELCMVGDPWLRII